MTHTIEKLTRSEEPMFKRLVTCLLILALVFLPSFAEASGTITGTMTTPSTSVPLKNATLTFTLNQAGIDVSNTYNLTTTPVSCYTANNGAVVGLPDPQVLPLATAVGAGGSLSGTYYVKVAYWVGATITSPSPVVAVTVGGGNNAIQVQPPVLQPAGATGYKIYIGTVSGSETLWATVTGWSSATFTIPTGSSALPTNNTVCSLTFNDAIIPTDTKYRVNVVDTNGRQVAGFPQVWRLSGTSMSVGTVFPVAVSEVKFPMPILSNPLSNFATQSINSPVTLNGFKLTAGALELPNNASPPATQSGRSFIYSDNTGTAKICQNGSPCTNLVTAGSTSGTTGTISKFTSATVLGDSRMTEDLSGGPGVYVMKLNERLLVNGTASDVTTGAMVSLGALTEANSATNAQTITLAAFGGGGGRADINSAHSGAGATKPLTFSIDGVEQARIDLAGFFQISQSYGGGTVSAAGTVALRNNSGVFEKSENGGGWTPVGGGGGGSITFGTLSPDTKPASPAAGELFFATDFNHLYRYTGAAWVFADSGNDYIEFFRTAPGTGWAACDGSSITIATSAGGTTSITAPNMTAGTFPYANGTYTGPTVTSAVAATQNSHSHGAGGLGTSASGGSDVHGAMAGGDFNAAGNGHIHVVSGSTAGTTATNNADGLPQREGFLCYLRK